MRKNGNNLILSDFQPDMYYNRESVVGVAKGGGITMVESSKGPPQFSPLSSRSASACPLVVSNCTRESQVANLSVIILKAKETWANLYAGIRERARDESWKLWRGMGNRARAQGLLQSPAPLFPHTDFTLANNREADSVREAAWWAGAGGKLWYNTQNTD